MRRGKKSSSEVARIPDPEPEPELPERFDLNADDEMLEEEVEYEEVEEEEEVIEEEEVEYETDEDAHEDVTETKADTSVQSDQLIADGLSEEDAKKHAELLALPPHGSEVYVGNIPHDASEDDLRSLCASVGEVTEVRMMKGNNSSTNKGYGFVTYRTKDLATKAIEELNNADFKGRKLKCSTSQAKNRLHLKNIPRNWSEDDLRKVLIRVGPGITQLELVKDQHNSSRNRGYAFVEYYNHACAEYSRQKMSAAKFKLDSNSPAVSWAESRSADASSVSQLKSIYIKNLPKNVTQDQLKKLFECHGEITRIVLPPPKAGHDKRYAFVHFKDRSMAVSAIQSSEKHVINGDVLECSFANPPSEKKMDPAPAMQNSTFFAGYPPRSGYSVPGSTYGVPSGYIQPMLYGGAQSAAGLTMVPLILPDGRLGYVMQQPGAAPHAMPQAGSNPRSGSSSGSGKSRDGSRGRRYQPY